MGIRIQVKSGIWSVESRLDGKWSKLSNGKKKWPPFQSYLSRTQLKCPIFGMAKLYNDGNLSFSGTNDLKTGLKCPVFRLASHLKTGDKKSGFGMNLEFECPVIRSPLYLTFNWTQKSLSYRCSGLRFSPKHFQPRSAWSNTWCQRVHGFRRHKRRLRPDCKRLQQNQIKKFVSHSLNNKLTSSWS